MGQVREQEEGQLQQGTTTAGAQPRQRAAVGILELPVQEAPFAVSFVPEAVERQQLEADQQARAIAQLDAYEFSSDEGEDTVSAMSGSGTSGSISDGSGGLSDGSRGLWEGYGAEEGWEGYGVFDSSEDVGSE